MTIQLGTRGRIDPEGGGSMLAMWGRLIATHVSAVVREVYRIASTIVTRIFVRSNIDGR